MNDPTSPFLQELPLRPEPDSEQRIRLGTDASPFLSDSVIAHAPATEDEGHKWFGKVEQSSSAKLEWVNFSTVEGSNGLQHAIYLVPLKPPKRSTSFYLKVTNTNSVYNFKDLRLRFRLVKTDDQVDVEILPDTKNATPPATASYHSTSVDGEIEDGHSRVIRIDLLVATLQRAYQNSKTRARLDVEFHWQEYAPGERPVFALDYYNKTSLGFYIFRPVEVLNHTLSQPKGEITTEDEKHRTFWVPVFEKTFRGSDKSPVNLTGSVTYSATKVDTNGIELTQRQSTSVTKGEEISASFTIGKKDLLQLGLGASARASESITDDLATTLVETSALTESFSKGLQINTTIAYPGRNKTRGLYNYPVFFIRDVTVVTFTGPPGGLGWANARNTRKVQLLTLKMWGQKQTTIDAKIARETEIEEWPDQETAAVLFADAPSDGEGEDDFEMAVPASPIGDASEEFESAVNRNDAFVAEAEDVD